MNKLPTRQETEWAREYLVNWWNDWRTNMIAIEQVHAIAVLDHYIAGKLSTEQEWSEEFSDNG